MKTEWTLEALYKGLDDSAYEADMKKCEQVVAEFAELVNASKEKKAEDVAEAILLKEEEMTELVMKLFLYLELRQSVETENGDVMAQMNRVMRIYNGATAAQAAEQKILAKIEDIDALGSELAVKEAGKLRSEGKEYVVQDGDVMHFRFNV